VTTAHRATEELKLYTSGFPGYARKNSTPPLVRVWLWWRFKWTHTVIHSPLTIPPSSAIHRHPRTCLLKLFALVFITYLLGQQSANLFSQLFAWDSKQLHRRSTRTCLCKQIRTISVSRPFTLRIRNVFRSGLKLPRQVSCSYTDACITHVSLFFFPPPFFLRWARLCVRGTGAANSPIVHLPDDTRVTIELRWNDTDRRKTASVPLCQTQTPQNPRLATFA
jgi:hypothetical protein